MPLPRKPGAYRDCYDIWSTAASTRGGCRTLIGPDYAAAEYLRARMHQSRSLLRDLTRRAYPTTHPLYDTSEYDAFKVTIKTDSDDNHYLYVEPHGDWTAVLNLEPIPDAELGALPPLDTPLAGPPLALTGPRDDDNLE